MVITRKIQICVYESDAKLKDNYVHMLYGWRDDVRRAANMVVSHKFVQQNVRDFIYLTEESLDRFLVKGSETDEKKEMFFASDILKKERGMSEQNTTYRLLATYLKGRVPADIYSCLNQAVCKSFKESIKDYLKGDAAIRSYKNNIPIPFSAKALSSLHAVDEEYYDSEGKARKFKRYYFNLFGIPFVCYLGSDRSNNAGILDSCIEGKIKVCSSSIAFEKKLDKKEGKKKQRLFLNLCIDVPVKEVELDSKKVLYAYLGISAPIFYACSVYDKKGKLAGVKWDNIGNEEEFLYRRTQIQDALRRLQRGCRYSRGGHGRTRKLQAIERFHNKEDNYVETKMHIYSCQLVKQAIKHQCGTIFLFHQKPREEEVKEQHEKGETTLLRNWSYFGLKEKIEYKCRRHGIKLVIDNEEKV